jgi:hypothetical protein
MKSEELKDLLATVAKPVYQIEVDLGMPKTTLQKAIKGDRELPKKWSLKLVEAFKPINQVKVTDATKPNKVIKEVTEPMPKKNYSIDTIPKTLEDLKRLCPKELTGFDRSEWIRENRAKYGI